MSSNGSHEKMANEKKPAGGGAAGLQDLGEFGLIARLGEVLKGTIPKGALGVGDDCAVLPAQDGSGHILLTTDTMLENRHFRWEHTSAEDLGWKLLAVNLSDIAAAGGVPVAAVLTLGIPEGFDPKKVERIYQGLTELAKLHHVAVAGGDTVKSEQFFVGAAVLGKAKAPLVRSGAQSGDDLWVSGTIGDGGLGLGFSEARISSEFFPEIAAKTKKRLQRPEPRLILGQLLSERQLATAAIDVSDGLIQDAGHIAKGSNVSLTIDLRAVPHTTIPSESWSILHACSAGDDYELLFTAAQSKRGEIEKLVSGLPGVPRLVRIGTVESAKETPAVFLISADGSAHPAAELLSAAGLPVEGGFNHFKG